MSTFANSEDPDEMQHNALFIRVYTVCKGKKDLQRKEYIFFLILTLYNGPSQVNCIKPKGRIH